MKKAIGILLLTMILCCTTACGDVSTANEENTVNSQSDSPEAAEKTDTTTESTEAKSEESEPDESTDDTPAFDFSEMIIVDNDDCVMKVTGIDEDAFWGYTLKVYIENKTADKTLMFSVDDVAVNGIMCDPLWSKSMMPNAKSNEEISFSESEFQEYGISDVFEITGTYRVYDYDDWFADNFANGDLLIYPQGEAYAETAVQPLTVSGETLFETDACRMVVTGYDSDSIWGYTMNVFLENKTDEALMFSIQDATVNGFSADPFWAKSVAGGKAAFSEIAWSSSDFEANGITNVEEITMIIHVRSDDDWTSDYLINDTYSVNP